MASPISTENLSDKLILSHCKDGFWLWDETREMNLSMKNSTREGALLEALKYYQDRLLEVEKEHEQLRNKVESFLIQFHDEDGNVEY